VAAAGGPSPAGGVPPPSAAGPEGAAVAGAAAAGAAAAGVAAAGTSATGAPEAAAPASAATPRPHRRRPRRVAARTPPPPPLIDRVKSALRADRRFNRVKAYTSGSTVTLFGTVYGDQDKRLAENTVRHVSGVTDVMNTITTDTARWAAEESQITQSLAASGITGVKVKVIGSDAYLSGQVKTDLDRQRAVTIAQAAAPVTVRSNMITVAVGNIFGF